MPEWGARVRARLAGLRLDPATEAETVEELAQHVDDRYRDLLARGATETEAAARAWQELEGHPLLAREISSARVPLAAAPIHNTSRGGVRAIVDDAGFAWRRLRHSPGFTVVAVLTVTLAVGANTAILSVADAVLFRPLPYANPDSVSIIQMLDRKSGRRFTMTPYAFLDAINDGCPSVSEVGLLEGGASVTVETADGPTSIASATATTNYFQILGVRAARGRVFDGRDEANAGRAVLLSYAAWRQRFGGDESVVGRTVTLGTSTFDVVGVLPSDFVFPSVFAGRPAIVVLRKALVRGTTGGTFHSIVRVAPGVPRERAQAELEAAAALVSSRLPNYAAAVPVLEDVRSVLYPVGRPVMRYLLGATGLILLLGLANLANMMLVRGRRSLRETAVRLALGASRSRLIRPIVFEAVFIGLAGAGLAILITSVTFDAMVRQVPTAAYARAPIGVGARVIVMSLAMGLFGALAFSVIPAWRATGADVLALIQRRGSRVGGSVRIGRPMVTVQVAVAVAVVFGAAMAARAFVAVLQTPLGFSADNVIYISIAPPKGTTDGQQFYERVITTLGHRPDVFVAGAAGSLPFSGQAADEGTQVAGVRTDAGIVHALPGYFEAASVQVRRGRAFTWDDARSDPNVAVVSESAARTLFRDREPIGSVFENTRGRQFRVVGVVADVRNSFDAQTRPQAYVLPGDAARAMNVVVRMRDRREAAIAELKQDLRALAPGVAPSSLLWWEDQIASADAYRTPRFQTMLLGSLATLAMGLTALGIFSVVAYLVAARTREMGVRLAIGASPQALVTLIVRQALIPVGAGLVIGLMLVKWGSQLAESQFLKVDTSDPLTLVAAIATVVVAAVLAAYLPARRATRINPTDVLRAE